MSGCYPSNPTDNKFCRHGHLLKNGCMECCMEENENVYSPKTLEALRHEVDHHRLINWYGELKKDMVHAQDGIVKCMQKIEKLEKLVIAHEVYLTKIDTIALCDPEKIKNNEKAMMERIERLEIAPKFQFDYHKLVFDRIDALEKFHAEWKAMPKYDLNPFINKVNEHIINKVNEYDENINDLKSKKADGNLVADHYFKVQNQIDVIVRDIRCIYKHITELLEEKDEKKLHQCPVCGSSPCPTNTMLEKLRKEKEKE